MATFKSFEEIEAWQKARKLANEANIISLETEMVRDFKLRDQVNGSTGSIMDNIAEGFERGGNREFIQFLSFSKGSAGEFRSQLYRMLDRKYVTEDEFKRLMGNTLEITSMLGGLMKYLQQSEIKGPKFRRTTKQ